MTIDAFENKATRLRQLALQAAAATGADGDTAQDIAQETMLRLWQMRDDPRLYNPEGYATVIARHLALSHQRHKPPLPLDERQATPLTAQTSPSPLDCATRGRAMAARAHPQPATHPTRGAAHATSGTPHQRPDCQDTGHQGNKREHAAGKGTTATA